jgi:hypothetical protein
MAFMKRKKAAFEGGGLVLFNEVSEAMRAEKSLKKAGYQVKLVAPPPELRRGCDLAVAINLVEKIVRVTDFGDWVMVKAANMKLTFDKKSGVIVNTSGGGCPDIPYMHAELIDKPLQEAPRPADLGFTLCALMLGRAFEESLALYKGGEIS